MKKTKGLYRQMLFITVLPVICVGVVIMLFCYQRYKETMCDEVEYELKTLSSIIEESINNTYPGDYRIIGNDYIAVLKGTKVINDKYDFIDYIKEECEFEVSLFYSDARVLTTIKDKEGNRITGSTAPSFIKKAVLADEKDTFYSSVDINGREYFAYYSTIYNSDGRLVGMLELAKPAKKVNQMIIRAVLPIMSIVFLFIALVAMAAIRYTTKLIGTIKSLDCTLDKIAKGDFTTDVDREIMERNDELGGIGKSISLMQKEIKKLVELDGLTGLLNRGNGQKKLQGIIKRSDMEGTRYTIAIGDIDYFKKINDNYGHNCGDYVLKSIADILKKHMRKNGIVCRWGGEEFLLVYENADIEYAYEELKGIMSEIRRTEFFYEKQNISVTMTFGIAEGNNSYTLDELVKCADEKLYVGKDSGRNKIVK